MISIILLVVAPIVLLGISRALNIYKNYQQARKLDLPIVIGWISWQDILWAAVGPLLRSWLRHFYDFEHQGDWGWLGWPYLDKHKIHDKLGPAFVHVTPFRNTVIISDVKASQDLFNRWRDWGKEPAGYSMFEIFGRNVMTVDGEDWQRHRKVTSYAFRESGLKLVWDSTIKQTEAMLAKWERTSTVDPARGVPLSEEKQDMHKMALHVLSAAAFGKEYDFDHGVDKLEGDHQLSYAEALETVLANVGPALFITINLFANVPLWLLRGRLRRLLLSIREYKQYLVEAVMSEKDRQSSKSGHLQDNLLSAMVHANEAAKQDKDAKLFLSDQDLYGNLFIMNAAGHETTAGALGYAIPLMAVYPDIQAWCQEEIDAVLADSDDVTYHATWQRLVRVRALMYETVRFFPPLPLFPKWSGHQPKVLEIQGKQYEIPADSFVALNTVAIHWNPQLWGADVETFNPRRWLRKQGQAGHEEFGGAPEGADTFLWSYGPRSCPGKKFSQVEFVAGILALLRSRTVDVAQSVDEDKAAARARLREVVMDSKHRLTMMMKHPERAGIICVPRR